MPQYPAIGVLNLGWNGASYSDVDAVQKSPAARCCRAMMASCSSAEPACELARRGSVGGAREAADHSETASTAISRWIAPSSESRDAVSDDLGDDETEDSVGHGERVAMRQLVLDEGGTKTASSMGEEFMLTKQAASTWRACAWMPAFKPSALPAGRDCKRWL